MHELVCFQGRGLMRVSQDSAIFEYYDSLYEEAQADTDSS